TFSRDWSSDVCSSDLQNYLAKQTRDQQITIELSDKLVRLFSSSQLPLIALRHLGLLSLESLPLLKDQFVSQTMGKAGRKYQWKEIGRASCREGSENVV